MTQEEQFLSYVFPILRYHSRFDELTGEDIHYLFRSRRTTWKGHLINQGVKPLEQLPAVRQQADYRFADVCWEYLEKIRLLCREQGAELILVKAPSVYPHWYPEYEAQIREYADAHDLVYYNLADRAEEIGIDYRTDTYDAGLHLNLSGATKLSRYFARVLAQEQGLPDRRSEDEVRKVWEPFLEQYDNAIRKEEPT